MNRVKSEALVWSFEDMVRVKVSRLALGLPAGSGEITPCTRTTHIRCPDMEGQLVTVYWNATRDPAVHGHRCPPQSSADHRCIRQLIP